MPSRGKSSNEPFRWDLVGPDPLGRLLEDSAPPSLWFLDALVACAAKVVARSHDGRLVFVGRSADSIFDLLSGVFAGSSRRDHLGRLPFSFRGDASTLSRREVREARVLLAACGAAPEEMARAPRPVTFVDLVARGYTFTNLYRLLRAWSDERKRPWAELRRKVRFVGITIRTKTSPKTWRWHQHADWTTELTARSVANVSLDERVWCYLGNDQPKLTRSFRPELWVLPEADGPQHDDATRRALAEAVAVVAAGRSRQTRMALRRVLMREPAYARPWLRALVTELRTSGAGA